MWTTSSVIALFLMSLGHQAWGREHPRELTMLKPNLIVGALRYRPHPRAKNVTTRRSLLAAAPYQGQRTKALSLGEYLITTIVNGYSISAVIDTGSGPNQVACTGTKADPSGGAVAIFNPNTAAPKFVTVAKTSTACKPFCAAAGDCVAKPAVAGACEYEYSYQDGSYLKARVYSGVMSFPAPVQLPAAASKISPFYFGGSYQTSTNPYMYSGNNALFGMDWEPVSFWGQMISSKLVADTTLYMCMGDGGDGFKTNQNGVIIFGTDNAVTVKNASVGGDVITATLANPYTVVDADGYLLLDPPSTWVTLNLMAIPGAGKFNMKPAYYLLDSGTSYLVLTEAHFNEFDAWFCSVLNTYSQVVTCDDSTSADDGYYVTMNKKYTPAQLDAVLPPISFTLKSGSKPVLFKPSTYMVYQSGARYLVPINMNALPTGLFGNAWMNGWLIQQTQKTLSLKMTRVKTCNDIAY